MIECDGDKVYRWIRQTDPESVSTILVGLQVDDGEDPELWKIVSVDLSRGTLELEFNGENRSISFDRLNMGYVIDTDVGELSKVLSENMTPSERCQESLRKSGFNPASVLRKEDSCIVLDILSEASIEDMTQEMIEEHYEILKRNDLYQLGAKYFSHLRNKIEPEKGPFDPDIRWRLGYFLRHVGRVEEAIRITDVIELPKSLFSPDRGQTEVLCAIRSAAYLDMHCKQNDDKWLKAARSYAARGYAQRGGGPELSNLYKRLEKLEREWDREKGKLHIKTELARLGDPDDDDIRKPRNQVK